MSNILGECLSLLHRGVDRYNNGPYVGHPPLTFLLIWRVYAYLKSHVYLYSVHFYGPTVNSLQNKDNLQMKFHLNLL
jgi:hypothetical protein